MRHALRETSVAAGQPPMLFNSTQPTDAADLLRVSEFQRRQRSAPDTVHTEAGATRLTSLNPSLLQDLLRFEAKASPGQSLEVLEVAAASVRHGRALLLHLQHGYRVIPVAVLPAQHQVRSPLDLERFLELRLPELRVLHVEPARGGDAGAATEAVHLLPLGPVLWELALRGSREALLPEIGGHAAYRIAPGAALDGLEISGTLAQAVARLRQQTTPLRQIAAWPGFDAERAMRLLNALYLQAALMVSRTHPAATNEGYFSPPR
jgi:hypothetical protein